VEFWQRPVGAVTEPGGFEFNGSNYFNLAVGKGTFVFVVR
jgi:hypothetical protein